MYPPKRAPVPSPAIKVETIIVEDSISDPKLWNNNFCQAIWYIIDEKPEIKKKKNSQVCFVNI